jgi:hypothetical protein
MDVCVLSSILWENSLQQVPQRQQPSIVQARSNPRVWPRRPDELTLPTSGLTGPRPYFASSNLSNFPLNIVVLCLYSYWKKLFFILLVIWSGPADSWLATADYNDVRKEIKFENQNSIPHCSASSILSAFYISAYDFPIL